MSHRASGKNRSGIFWLALLAWLLAGPAIGGVPETVARLKASVVGVGTVEKTRRPPALLLGSGFVVGDGRHVLTNAHVVSKSLNEKGLEYLAVFIGSGSEADVRQARVVARDKEHDLALLEFGGSPQPAARLGDSDRVREGEEFLFTGFPLGSALGLYPATHRAMLAAIVPIALPALASRQLSPTVIRRLRHPFRIFQLDGTAYPGNSGSPLYSPDSGEVVGILNMVFVKASKESALSHPSGIAYAIPIAHARRLLESALP
ncbi:serine protease [Thiohalobacter sp. IOR34]|uniref:S1 family peptidase n=1 Tax=Thiohalobacter sp. IOR34 TaxID=3057176 RepID=UPI0025B1E273|nr:serine protease [Thiohalobacter sp. IOR34]WJW74431.1 serine protease [Thiohalobacter sp. IOR34]